MKHSTVFIGYDTREHAAFEVARSTMKKMSVSSVSIVGLHLPTLESRNLYSRPTARSGHVIFDLISGAFASTEFANSRFLVPELMRRAGRNGWGMFMDCDMLVRHHTSELLGDLDPRFAVYCVKHKHNPPPGTKMDGQVQQQYARKNWSSVMIFNVEHPSNKGLTVEMINSLPGRDLHRFCWLKDEEIGELNPKWNWLVGHSSPDIDPGIVHFTEGLPNVPGYEKVAFADEWRAALKEAVVDGWY